MSETETMTSPIRKTVQTSTTIVGLECPTCGEAAAPPANNGGKSPRPFCSTRCAEVDLGRWFRGQYTIPAVDAADDTIVEALIAKVETAAGESEK